MSPFKAARTEVPSSRPAAALSEIRLKADWQRSVMVPSQNVEWRGRASNWSTPIENGPSDAPPLRG